MGFDTSHHPIDEVAFQKIAAFLAGEGSIDALIEDALRIGRVRFRANAWGLGLFRYNDEHPVARFDARLHVWGRPFFVGVEGTDAIATMIDRYLAAKNDAETDAIAHENLRAIDPALPSVVKPSSDGNLPPDSQLRVSLRANLDLLRRAVAIAEKGGTIALPNGEDVDAAQLVGRDSLFQILSLAAEARPGWMDRGFMWPQALCTEAGVSTGDLFETPRVLLGALGERKLPWVLESDLTENYMAGGYVRAARVPELHTLLVTNRAALEACYPEDGGPNLDVKCSVQKLIEAVADAQRRGYGFLQATEIYSGFSGVMN